MNLLIIQLTYLQIRILNFCLIIGFIFCVFSIYGYFEEKAEKKKARGKRMNERHKDDLQKYINTVQQANLYEKLQQEDKKYKYNASICADCVFGTSDGVCHYKRAKSTFTDDIGIIVDCNKYFGVSNKAKK